VKYAPLVARLAVYATALAVVITARLPDASTGISALRAPVSDPLLDPVRLLLFAVLGAGAITEFLRRRPLWR
jgi:hypothetical protein